MALLSCHGERRRESERENGIGSSLFWRVGGGGAPAILVVCPVEHLVREGEKEGARGERTRNTDMLCLAVLRDCLLEKMYCISPVLPTLVVQGY